MKGVSDESGQTGIHSTAAPKQKKRYKNTQKSTQYRTTQKQKSTKNTRKYKNTKKYRNKK